MVATGSSQENVTNPCSCNAVRPPLLCARCHITLFVIEMEGRGFQLEELVHLDLKASTVQTNKQTNPFTVLFSGHKMLGLESC